MSVLCVWACVCVLCLGSTMSLLLSAAGAVSRLLRRTLARCTRYFDPTLQYPLSTSRGQEPPPPPLYLLSPLPPLFLFFVLSFPSLRAFARDSGVDR